MTDDKRRNPVLASLSVLMVLALSSLPFLQLAPNRLVSGKPLYFFSIIHGSAFLLVLMFVLLTVCTVVAMFKPRTAWLWAVLTVAAMCIPSLLWLAANQASISLQGELPIARASLGSAFWVALVLLGLMVISAVQQLRLAPLQTAAVCAALLLVSGGLLASGVCEDL